jgi:glucosamine--fructose-6-phosphate aminotransferase (isomerizing)
MPGNVIAPYDRMFKKGIYMQEVATRDGKIILSSDPQGAPEARVDSLCKLTLPAMPTTVIRLSYCRGDGQNTSTSREALPSRSPWNDRR